jgi:ribosomal protein L11 methyltransferase
MTTLAYQFNALQKEVQEIRIAQLELFGFHGFEEQENCLLAYVNAKDLAQEEFSVFISQNNITYTKSIIEERNWNADWERDFHPVTVSLPNSDRPFVHIRAAFHPTLPEAQYDLLITPKMSFGTGHHATTYGMVEAMNRIQFKGKKIIDFGTGTGVLAVLAEKLGAKEVLAIDCDEWSISNAAENLAANHCKQVRLLLASELPEKAKCDILIANINLNILRENMNAIFAAGLPGCQYLFSGFLETDLEEMKGVLTKAGLKVSTVYQHNQWLVIAATI